MYRCCYCRCHRAPDDEGALVAVNVLDPIAAATACSSCLAHHAPALSSTLLANELEASPRPRASERAPWIDSDGAGMPGD